MLACPFCGEAPRPEEALSCLAACSPSCARTTVMTYGPGAWRWSLMAEGEMGEDGMYGGRVVELAVFMGEGGPVFQPLAMVLDGNERVAEFLVAEGDLSRPMDELLGLLRDGGAVASVLES